jgi:carboxylesterase type B
LSKLVGLFHRAISQTGTAFHWWGFTSAGRDRSFRLGQALGCNTNNPDELLEFLQNAQPKDIVEAMQKVASKEVNAHTSTWNQKYENVTSVISNIYENAN